MKGLGKRLLRVLTTLCCVFSVACPPVARAGGRIEIVVATDLHYLSPALTDYGQPFMKIIEGADGKVTQYTPQLARAFVEQMLEQKPAAVILSGDLTLNGAPQSHQEVAALLQRLRDAGIQVLALPGNHDVGKTAYRFGPEGATRIEGTDAVTFLKIYQPFGYEQALSRDEASLSYLAPLAPKLWCLMVDVNANGSGGTVRSETLAWARAQLEKAREAGVTVLAVSHQNLLPHSQLFSSGYVMANSAALRALYEEYGVRLHLSGHMHLQHSAQDGAVADIATASLAIAPNQFGVLHVDGGQLLSYETQQVDVGGWARRNGLEDQNLLGFCDYARDFFDQTTRRQAQRALEKADAGDDEKRRMADLAVQLNAQYFTGTRRAMPQEADWALWQRYLPDAFFTFYLKSILDEPPKDMNALSFAE